MRNFMGEEENKMTAEDLRRMSLEANERNKKTNKPNQFDLLDLYVDQQKDLRDLGAEFLVSKDTARIWLIEAEIPLRARGVRSKGYGDNVLKRFLEASDRLQGRHVSFKVTATFLPTVVEARITALKDGAADLIERRVDDVDLLRKILDEANLLERLLIEFVNALRELQAIRAGRTEYQAIK